MNNSDDLYALLPFASSADMASSVPTVDALTFLRAEHRELQDLFDDFRDAVERGAHEADRIALAQLICMLLELHSRLEEEIFYPTVRKAVDHRQLLDEALVEHDCVRQLMMQIAEAGGQTSMRDARVNVLGEYMQHHIREEEDEIFPLVESSELDIDELGAALDARKQELMDIAAFANL